MPGSFCPRLSEAGHLLPALREHLAAAASHATLPIGFTLDLLPIADGGVFGYELVPNRDAPTYLTIGRDHHGEPVVRRCLYCAVRPSALRLAAVNGRFPSQHQLDAWHHIEQRDERFADWPAAADAVWAELGAMFPEPPQRSVSIHEDVLRDLDAALATAHDRLGGADPRVAFAGVPHEAQYGFVLERGPGERGLLVAWPPGRWELRWESPQGGVRETWDAVPVAHDAASGWAVAGTALCEGTLPLGLAAALSAAAPRQGRRY